MKILYVAKHGSGDNDDEGAIAHALRQLGHEVLCLPENMTSPDGLRIDGVQAADLLLFHKWYDFESIARCKAKVKAFWHFDLVESDDWELQDRSRERVQWMRDVTPLVTLGFCTDGDWVARDATGKLRWLMQGADERVMGPGDPEKARVKTDILFTGSVIHGGKRIDHIRHLQDRWGDRFTMFGHRPKDRLHGRALADLLAGAKVVIAPDGPVTDRYWSNRVYQALGFGAFLIHPWCAGLADHYDSTVHLQTYRDRHSFDALIGAWLEDAMAAQRAKVAAAGYRHTVANHTYRHRCADLIRAVEEKL